jgi:hypothetical protein
MGRRGRIGVLARPQGAPPDDVLRKEDKKCSRYSARK